MADQPPEKPQKPQPSKPDAPEAPKEQPKGLYRRKKDNRLYALQIVADAPPFLGRTYIASGEGKAHWKGTKAQFVKEFTAVDGPTTTDPKPSSVKKLS